jgi:hypothetical protein
MTQIDDSFEAWVELRRSVTCDEHFADRVMTRIRRRSDLKLQERFVHLAGRFSQRKLVRAGVVAACVALGAMRLLLITRVLLG